MVESVRPARIWYQSFVHPIGQAPYIASLQAELDRVAGADMHFEVDGLDPAARFFHPRTEFRCTAHTIPSSSIGTTGR